MRTLVLASLACVLVACEGGQIATTTPAPNMLGLQAKNTGEFAAASAPLPDTVSFDGAINAIQRAPDGTVYVGGAFTRVGAVTGPAVPIDGTTGELVDAKLPRFVGQANAVAADGSGGWYVGGTFTVETSGGQVTNLAHVLANNTIDANFHPNPNNAVLALAVSGTAVYAGGRFTVIGGAARNRLAALSKSSGAVLLWNPDVDGTVNTVLVSGKTVYAGGAFATVGGNARSNLAAFNAADAQPNPGTLLPWNPNANNGVAALDIAGGTVYAGGSFTTIGGTSRRALAAITATGTGTVSAWNPAPNGDVTTLAVRNTGGAVTVYFSGSFDSVTDPDTGPQVRQHLAAVNAKGVLSSWDPAPNNPASALRIFGSTVYVGGSFTALHGQTRNRLAAIGIDGTLLAWNPSAHDAVNALAVAGGGNTSAVVYAGGLFPSVGGVARNFLAAMDASGALLPWNPNANSFVQSLAVSGTTIYAAGDFTQVGGLNRSHLAAISANGVVSPTWAPAANSLVYAIVVSGNTLYAGGQFTAVNGTTRNRLAAVDANPAATGQLFPQWNPNVADGAVYALTLADGVLYAGGNFTGVGGLARNRLASVSAAPNAAATVSSWNPNVAGGDVLALASADGVVYVGGSFSTVGGLPRTFLAALDASGNGQVRDWAPSPNAYVTSLAISGAVVYLGGAFNRINSVVRNGLAAVGTSGNVLAFDPNANGVANALTVSGNTVYAGGLFSSLDGAPHGHIGFIPAVQMFTVSGSLAGLNGGTVTLQNNGNNPLTLSANGSFAFTAPIAAGDTYNVTVRTQPSSPSQVCAVTNGSGTITANVTNVAVGCTDGQLPATAGTGSATLSWATPPNATRFNLFVYSARNCDVANYPTCPDGALLTDVSSPRTVTSLRNGQPYFFRLETVFSNGARTLSSEAGSRPNVLALTGLGGHVKAMAAAADGTVYLGGEFLGAGIMTGSFVPLDNVAGQPQPTNFPIVDGVISAVVSDGAGGWYIGGNFQQVGAVHRRHLAHLLADGTVAASFAPDPDGQVLALARLRGTLYVSGLFATIGGVPREFLAALDSNGSPVPWAPHANEPPAGLAAAGNTVYAGGGPGIFGSGQGFALAAINAADAPGAPGAFVPWAQPTESLHTETLFVGSFAISGDIVVIGGSFDAVDGRAHSNVAALRTVETTTPGVSPVLSWSADTDHRVNVITLAPGRIYIGGSFLNVNGQPRAMLAAFDNSSTPGALLPWHPAVTAGATDVSALAASSGRVYFGGRFTGVNGAPRNNIAAVDDAAGTLLPWNPSADGEVSELAVAGDTVFAAGRLVSVNNQQRNRLAAVDANGALLPWNPDANSIVDTVGVLRDVVYVGGQFSAIGGIPRNGLAAIGANGVLSNSFPSGTTSVPHFRSIAISRHPLASAQLDRIYATNGLEIAGFYPADAGVNAGVRVNLNPVITGGAVRALTWTNNSLIAGGDFTAVDGVPRQRLALWSDAIDPDHPELLAWEVRVRNPPSTFASVNTLTSGSGVVYAAGIFTQLEDFFRGVQARDGFGAFFSQGSVQDWVAPPVHNAGSNLPFVQAIARSGDDIYVLGDFTQVGTTARAGAAKFSPDGTPDPNWHPALHDVDAIAVANGKLYLGGEFINADGQPRFSFAIVNADGSIAQ